MSRGALTACGDRARNSKDSDLRKRRWPLTQTSEKTSARAAGKKRCQEVGQAKSVKLAREKREEGESRQTAKIGGSDLPKP